jgi:hypothetical protein
MNFIKEHSTSSKDVNILLDDIIPYKQVKMIIQSNKREKNKILPLHSGFLQQQQQQQLQQQKKPKHNQHIIDIIPKTRKNEAATAWLKYLKKLSFNFPSPSITSIKASIYSGYISISFKYVLDKSILDSSYVLK